MTHKQIKATIIEIEGTDGAGKTTALKYFIDKLKQEFPNKTVVETREVGSPLTPITQKLRELALSPNSKLDGTSMELLFAAMRIEQMKVYAEFDENTIIVSDRGWLSHLAYTDHNVSAKFTTDFYIGIILNLVYLPTHIIYLSVDEQTALERRNKRNGFVDVIEAKGVEFQAKVRESFEKYIRESEVSVFRINANGTKEDVQQELDNFIRESL